MDALGHLEHMGHVLADKKERNATRLHIQPRPHWAKDRCKRVDNVGHRRSITDATQPGHVSFVQRRGRALSVDLHQSGSAKVMLPSVPGDVPEVVLLNTFGVLGGGGCRLARMRSAPNTTCKVFQK
jgi:hypothetical protein